MSIENTLERIAAALENLAAGTAPQEVQAVVAETPVKPIGRPKKEVKEKVVEEGKESQPTSAITIEVLRSRARQLGEINREEAVAIVKGFGVATLGDIPVEKYEAAYNQFDTKIVELEKEVL